MSRAKQGAHVPAGAFVVVCDGRKSLLFRNVGSPASPRLQLIEKRDAPPNPPTHLQGADRPGRTQSSQGRASAVGQTDWHEEAERSFVKATTKRLQDIVQTAAASALTVVAPPRTLATLRHEMPASLTKIIAGEFAGDLTGHTVSDIEAWLATKY